MKSEKKSKYGVEQRDWILRTSLELLDQTMPKAKYLLTEPLHFLFLLKSV